MRGATMNEPGAVDAAGVDADNTEMEADTVVAGNREVFAVPAPSGAGIALLFPSGSSGVVLDGVSDEPRFGAFGADTGARGSLTSMLSAVDATARTLRFAVFSDEANCDTGGVALDCGWISGAFTGKESRGTGCDAMSTAGGETDETEGGSEVASPLNGTVGCAAGGGAPVRSSAIAPRAESCG